jgi:hypothetical protein
LQKSKKKYFNNKYTVNNHSGQDEGYEKKKKNFRNEGKNFSSKLKKKTQKIFLEVNFASKEEKKTYENLYSI